MKLLTLKRITSNFECVCGVLTLDQEPICLTLENAWCGNLKNLSCIPAGEYHCQPYASRKFGNVYKVDSVPDRTGILFHVGNTVKDSTGCILVGSVFGKLGGRMAVLNSRIAKEKLLNAMKGEKEFLLRILDV